MIKVIVNDVELDLKSNTVVALTKKTASIGTLNSRFSSYTNKFQIPKTKKNRDALGLTQIEDASGTQYEEQVGKIVSGGLEIATNVAVIIESVAKDITLSIRAGNGNLFDRLNKTMLSELDLSDLFHLWNSAQVWLFRDANYTNGYCYPLSQTGNQSTIFNSLQAAGVIPFVFVKALYERISTMFGYSWTGSTYSLSMFENLTVPISTLSLSESFSNLMVGRIDANSGTQSALYTITTLNTYTYLIDYGWTEISDVYNNFRLTNALRREYTVPYVGDYSYNFDYDFTATQSSGANAYFFRAIIDIVESNENSGIITVLKSVTLDCYTIANHTGTLSGVYSNSITSTSEPSHIRLWVRTRLQIQTLSPTVTLASNYNTGEFSITEVKATVSNYNRYVSIADMLPDITIGKFIKEVGNIFGAIYDVDEYSKEIEITRLDEIATNKAQAYDWSDKLDLSIQPEVTFIIGEIGQTTTLQWNDPIKHEKSIAVANEQLPDSSAYVKSDADFSDSATILKYPTPIISMPFWDESERRIIPDGTFRFALIQQESTQPITYTVDGITPPFTETSYKVAYFDYENSPYSLDWVRLFDDFYAGLFNPMTDRMMKVSAYFKLNDLDIQAFRFKYPVFVAKFNRYFFVDEISEYTGSEQSTKVTLVAI